VSFAPDLNISFACCLIFGLSISSKFCCRSASMVFSSLSDLERPKTTTRRFLVRNRVWDWGSHYRFGNIVTSFSYRLDNDAVVLDALTTLHLHFLFLRRHKVRSRFFGLFITLKNLFGYWERLWRLAGTVSSYTGTRTRTGGLCVPRKLQVSLGGLRRFSSHCTFGIAPVSGLCS
jgi:hypothetical protein